MKKQNTKQFSGQVIILFALILLVPIKSPAQDINSVVDGMENAQNIAENVNNYTVTQSTFIKSIPQPVSTTVTYHERGENGFKAMDSAGMQNESTAKLRGLVSLGNASAQLYSRLRNKAQYRGTETINGDKVYVLHTTDASIFTGSDENESDNRFKMTEAFFYVGVDDFSRRGMRIKGESTESGQTERVDMVFTMTDFRDVDGLRYSFLTTVKVSGIEVNAVTAQKDQAREALAAMEEKIRRAPRLTRRTLERSLKSEMDALRATIADDTITILLKVDDLKVNAGQPTDD